MKEVKNYNRMELFKHYNECDSPFIIITIPVEITQLVNYCKIHKNFYGMMGYVIMISVNNVDEFKYRYIDNKIYYCDKLNVCYTQKLNDEKIGYFSVDYSTDYKKFTNDFIENQNQFYQEGTQSNRIDKLNYDEVWVSCAPWFKFTSLMPPINRNNNIPQFIWDKYEEKDGKYFVNMMIMVHHGFADGYHIKKIIDEFEKNIKEFEIMNK